MSDELTKSEMDSMEVSPRGEIEFLHSGTGCFTELSPKEAFTAITTLRTRLEESEKKREAAEARVGELEGQAKIHFDFTLKAANKIDEIKSILKSKGY